MRIGPLLTIAAAATALAACGGTKTAATSTGARSATASAVVAKKPTEDANGYKILTWQQALTALQAQGLVADSVQKRQGEPIPGQYTTAGSCDIIAIQSVDAYHDTASLSVCDDKIVVPEREVCVGFCKDGAPAPDQAGVRAYPGAAKTYTVRIEANVYLAGFGGVLSIARGKQQPSPTFTQALAALGDAYRVNVSTD